jgi:hypothetical protein
MTEANFVLDRWTGFVPAPLAVTCAPGKTSFALVGVGSPEEFYWSAFRETGESFEEGWERSLQEAQSVAQEAQQRWSHCGEPRTRRQCAACLRHASAG